jgi:hypothetical protein
MHQRIRAACGAPAISATSKIALAWSVVHGLATLTLDDQSFAAAVAWLPPADAEALCKKHSVVGRGAFLRIA